MWKSSWKKSETMLSNNNRCIAECRKFSPNIFNKNKCTLCFGKREEHNPAALDYNRVSLTLHILTFSSLNASEFLQFFNTPRWLNMNTCKCARLLCVSYSKYLWVSTSTTVCGFILETKLKYTRILRICSRDHGSTLWWNEGEAQAILSRAKFLRIFSRTQKLNVQQAARALVVYE